MLLKILPTSSNKRPLSNKKFFFSLYLLFFSSEFFCHFLLILWFKGQMPSRNWTQLYKGIYRDTLVESPPFVIVKLFSYSTFQALDVVDVKNRISHQVKKKVLQKDILKIEYLNVLWNFYKVKDLNFIQFSY